MSGRLNLGSTGGHDSVAPGAVPRLSIVIPTLNSGATLADCLSSLGRQTSKDFEIIIVDAGSTDGTAKIAGAFGVKILDSGRYRLLGQRLLGARSARAHRCLLLDSDQVLADSTVEKVNDTPMGVDMIFLGERSYNIEKLLSRLADIDRRLIQSDFRSQVDPASGALHPRVFRTSLYLEAFAHIPTELLTLSSNWVDAIHYSEARRISNEFAFISDAVFHQDRDDLAVFMRHYFRYGRNLRSIQRFPIYSKLVQGRISGRKLLLRRDLPLSWRVWSTIYMILKAVPHTAGYITGAS